RLPSRTRLSGFWMSISRLWKVQSRWLYNSSVIRSDEVKNGYILIAIGVAAAIAGFFLGDSSSPTIYYIFGIILVDMGLLALVLRKRKS
ncbi:MAG TPA: hypothetical protein VMR98_05335, partial [Candidatus Polarisedimenticolaceae bacterium]|nr:hypothetical protein [Candidatus Polarisedimenticolaceae bacterium]